MELMQAAFAKLFQILSIKIYIGSLSFTLFQLQCFFFAIAIIGYFVYGVFEDD